MTKALGYQELLEYILKTLADHPEDVKVEKKVDEMGVLLNVKMNPSDMGIIIGKKGSTVRAIRTILRAVGLKSNARVNLKIEEPEGGKKESRTSNSSNEDLNVEEIKI